MLIACKYEEIWPPLIKDYVYMCDQAYNKEQIVEMEISMLTVLDFNVDFVSSNSFLERFVQITQATKQTHDLAQYILEITLLDFQVILARPSILSLGSLLLATKILQNPQSSQT